MAVFRAVGTTWPCAVTRKLCGFPHTLQPIRANIGTDDESLVAPHVAYRARRAGGGAGRRAVMAGGRSLGVGRGRRRDARRRGAGGARPCRVAVERVAEVPAAAASAGR